MNLQELVNHNMDRFTSTDLLIWKYICMHRRACMKISIIRLAKACNVSTTTILRFAKKLSLDGFADLKSRLRLESEQKTAVIAADAMHTVNKLCGSVGKAMQYQDFDAANRMIFQAKRVFLYAVGTFQHNVSREMIRLFMKENVCVYEMQAEDIMDKMDKDLQYLTPEEDVVIIISLRGESHLVREMAERMRLQGIPVISVTRHTDNTLSQMAEVNLYADTALVQGHEIVIMFYILIEVWYISYCQFTADYGPEIAG